MAVDAAFMDTEYDMNHLRRGYALILNNKDFEPRTRMGTRRGSDIDAGKLLSMCTRLGFETQLKNNQTCQNMRDAITEGKRI